MHEVKVPEVGESITEVTIATWLKNDGDYVSADDLICEIESDKASFEIPADAEGVLKQAVAEGDTIEVGTVIARIDSDAKAPSDGNGKAKSDDGGDAKQQETKTDPPARREKASAAKDTASGNGGGGEVVHTVVIPEVGESITEVTLAEWRVGDGEAVKADQTICDIESDKAGFELTAEADGILHHLAKADATLGVGDAVAEIRAGGESSAPSSDKSAEAGEGATSGDDASGDDGHGPRISPVAARILDEAGIGHGDVKGSGPGGRITKEDARKAVDARETASETTTSKTATPSTQPKAAEQAAPPSGRTASGERPERRQKMSTLRKTISRRLVAAKNETAMLTTFNEVDMGAIMALRSRYKEAFKEKHEVGLGFMSFFARACCMALQEWPTVNAKIDGEEILFADYVDISIAVSTPKGLVVPVIRNAESLSLAGIEKEVIHLATKARDGKLTIEEMTGGTFTITNGGVFGSLMSTPIINAPQSAILGMHKIQERPMVVDGEITVRPMMYVALSYDHRIIDGRESVSFLVRVKELLEDPARMLLDI